jgi:hypothetical protein
MDPIQMHYETGHGALATLYLTPQQSQQLRKMLERAEIAFQALVDSHAEKGR